MCDPADWDRDFSFLTKKPEPPVTADHTPKRLSAEEREAICRAGFSTHDHLLQRDPAIAAFEAILAAHLADVEARLAAGEALADRFKRRAAIYGGDDDNESNIGMAAAYLIAAQCLGATLHPNPSARP